MSDPDSSLSPFSISALLRDYRLMAGLSQDALAALSADLYDQGVLDRAISQSQIARWEKPDRIERLREDSIEVMAALLATALQQAGYDGAKAKELKRFLEAANLQFADVRTVSVFALEMDALMSPWPNWIKEIIRHVIRQMLLGTDSILKAHIARVERARQIQDTIEGDVN